MTDEILLRFSVKDDGSPVIERVNKKIGDTKKQSESLVPGLENAGKSLASFASNNAVLLSSLTAVGVVLKKSFDEYQKYAAVVRDTALASGTTAEEASRLLQVFDDYQISAQDVTAAMKAMKEQGMVPTIDTLAQLASGYQAITDPAQKLQFVYDNLGRSGSKFLNVLQQSPDALREQASQISKNLILNDEQIADAEEARLAIDALNDSVQGAKVSLGAWAGGLIVANKTFQDNISLYKEWHKGIEGGRNAFEAFNAQMERGRAMTEFYSQGLAQIAETAGMTEEQLKELAATNATIIQGAIDITDSNKAYEQSQADIVAQIEELQAKKSGMYAWETEAIAGVDEQIAELEDRYASDADAFEQASIRKLTMMALEKIEMSDGAAGFSEAEAAKAQALLTTAGVAEESALRQMLAYDQVSTKIADGTLKAQELDATLKLMSKGYTIDVVMNTIANLTQGNRAMSGGGSMMAGAGYDPKKGYADGGISTGPTSGHMEMLHGTEAVIPLKNGSIPVSMQGGGGGGGGMEMTTLMAFLGKLPNDIARALSPIVEKTGRR